MSRVVVGENCEKKLFQDMLGLVFSARRPLAHAVFFFALSLLLFLFRRAATSVQPTHKPAPTRSASYTGNKFEVPADRAEAFEHFKKIYPVSRSLIQSACQGRERKDMLKACSMVW